MTRLIAVGLFTALSAGNFCLSAELSLTSIPSSPFTIGDTIVFSVNIDMDSIPTNGVSVYISFDDAYFSIIDQDTSQSGIQPFQPGSFLAGTVLENDTHGDPGNTIPLFQLDYAEILFSSATTGGGMLAGFALIAHSAGDSISLSVDNDEPFRNTSYIMPDSSFSYQFDTVVVPVISISGPLPVMDLVIEPTGTDDIALFWSPPDTIGQYSYRIYRSDTPYFDFTTFTPLIETTDTTFTDFGARLENMFFYQVISIF